MEQKEIQLECDLNFYIAKLVKREVQLKAKYLDCLESIKRYADEKTRYPGSFWTSAVTDSDEISQQMKCIESVVKDLEDILIRRK